MHSPTLSLPKSAPFFLPPPSLRLPQRTFHPQPPRMISQSAKTFLHKIRVGLVNPACPKSLGLQSRLPRSARLFVDSHTRVAIACSTLRSRFTKPHADALLSFVHPLMEKGTVSQFLIALEGGADVARTVEDYVRDMGVDLLSQNQLHQASSPVLDSVNVATQPQKSANKVAVFTNGGTSAELAVSPDDTSGSQVLDSQSPLRVLSRQRKRDAGKRVRRTFQLQTDHRPAGDQPKAIRALTDGLLRQERRFQTLHGVTGSGKTFIMASIIANVNVPTLILAPNKTLAAQLCSELTKHFPSNRVEFFVSHFKHYQPEAYLPASDKYIAKSSSVDPDIDRLRHAATRSLFERNDTIVVASVSSIYGLGLPTEYLDAALRIQVGDKLSRGPLDIAEGLIELLYTEETSAMSISRGRFRTQPDMVEVSPPWEPEGTIYRITFEGGVIVRMTCSDNDAEDSHDLGEELVLYPAKHFVTPKERLELAIQAIQEEAEECVKVFRSCGKELEATRLQERVFQDIEMMKKVGYCHGAENYSLYLTGRQFSSDPGPPQTLVDYMPRDGKWLLFIDESHVTVPQLGAMHAGNAARKVKLIEHGFRLPSSMENRPLNSEEFWQKAHQTIFVTATPGPFELQRSGSEGVVQAVIRPTGVVDPTIDVVRTEGQIEHLTLALARVAATGSKAIVTTLTKRFAEDLADCLSGKPPIPGVLNRPLRVAFLHSGIDSVGRMQVLEAMKDGFPHRGEASAEDDTSPEALDVIVGVNLLREGIDLPAVRLVAILDADSEGFLRGETALIQTIGRAARNVDGHVIMYADSITAAMRRAIGETARRRRLQIAHNSRNDIIPRGVGFQTSAVGEDGDVLLNRIRKLRLEEGNVLTEKKFGSNRTVLRVNDTLSNFVDSPALDDSAQFSELRSRMLQAAEEEDFETAAMLRDYLVKLTSKNRNLIGAPRTSVKEAEI
eukprot:GFKZ01005858.1.p1 GENE.GFKZ01005858.1~~GFKZ01005858.1.p1  ORF type:complete len:953 (-),score=148.03 GFKZ01005858.1:183-3041(-)